MLDFYEMADLMDSIGGFDSEEYDYMMSELMYDNVLERDYDEYESSDAGLEVEYENY